MIDEAPRLRPIEAFPVEHEGQRLLALRDPAGYTPSILLLPLPLVEVLAGDAGAFFESVASDHDRRRICGLSPIYALLHTLDGGAGSLRRYGQWPDPGGVVSYASMVF